MMMPQNKFTDGFKRAMQVAREEGIRLQHDYVGTEHVLLAIIKDREDPAAVILSSLGIDLDKLRQSIEEATRASAGALSIGQIPFTPRAKQVLEIAAHEASSMKSKQIGTEHLLLALVRDKQGSASQILTTYEVTYEKIKDAVKSPRSDQSAAERMHIFQMLANGTITAEEADRLLRAIEESRAAESSSKPSDKPRWLRIRITEDGVEKVKLNLPLSLARMGLAFLPSTAMLQINAKGIDLERLLQADLAEAGTLIELEDEGNKIEVYVE